MNIIIQTIISATSGAGVGGLFTVGYHFWILKNQKRQDAYYATIRIVCVLDSYVDACAKVVNDDGTYHGQPAGKDGVYEAQVCIPDKPVFSADINWKSLDAKLAYRILNLSSTIERINSYIAAQAEEAFSFDGSELSARRDGYLQIGLAVIDLVKDLRKTFRLPARNVETSGSNWDVEAFFKEKLKKFYEMKNKVPFTTV